MNHRLEEPPNVIEDSLNQEASEPIFRNLCYVLTTEFAPVAVYPEKHEEAKNGPYKQSSYGNQEIDLVGEVKEVWSCELCTGCKNDQSNVRHHKAHQKPTYQRFYLKPSIDKF